MSPACRWSMVAKPPVWLLGRASVACSLGGCVGRVRHPCPFVVVVWLVFVGGLGGIATIGAALRRVAGVSVVYGRKTPRVVARKGQRRVLFRWLCWSCSTSLSICRGGVACFRWWLGGNCYHRRCFAACRRRVGGLWSQNPPCGCSEGPASRARGGVYGRKIPRVVAWKGQGRVLFRWLCWSCSARLRLFVVACLCWWLGGNCYHRRCVAACRRRVGGLWSQNPPSGCS